MFKGPSAIYGLECMYFEDKESQRNKKILDFVLSCYSFFRQALFIARRCAIPHSHIPHRRHARAVARKLGDYGAGRAVRCHPIRRSRAVEASPQFDQSEVRIYSANQR